MDSSIAKVLLVGTSCYECVYYFKVSNFCGKKRGFEGAKLPDELTCKKWEKRIARS